jgi:glutamate racemase
LIVAKELPIGVFDSGVGGLTVLRALRARLPGEHFLYLGDTARLPYGTKSVETVLRYSLQAADFLVGRGLKYLVVACNTASAAAVETLRARYSPMPVIGVIEPGVTAGCRASRSGHIAVIATEGTVRGGAYQRSIERERPEARVVARACSLFVSLAEEGWTEGPIVEAVAHRYLDDLFGGTEGPDTLLLGCTHFPVLGTALREVVGPGVTIVDSAETTATFVAGDLESRALMRPRRGSASMTLYATDGVERFAAVGGRFLGSEVGADEIELVDLQALP